MDKLKTLTNLRLKDFSKCQILTSKRILGRCGSLRNYSKRLQSCESLENEKNSYLDTEQPLPSPWTTWNTSFHSYSNPGVEREQSFSYNLPPPRLSVAPMMEYTDAHFRQLARLLSSHTWLYTEMVVDNTLKHQQPNLDKWLEFPECQHPLVLQLGGSEPDLVGEATRLSHPYKYDEINLNCGCPSSAVAGHGCFGARLMLEPERVASITSAMADATNVPITVKCRIGVDDQESYEELCNFVQVISEKSPVEHFVIHSRKAILKGLSPAQNRSVPPLKDFPHLKFTLNGGIVSLSQAVQVLNWGVHGVMIGRAAYKNPWQILADADRAIYGAENRAKSRRKVLEEYCSYADQAKGRYGPHRPSVRTLVMPLSSLFHSEPGGANWRRAIESSIRESQSVSEVVEKAVQAVPSEVLDAPPGLDYGGCPSLERPTGLPEFNVFQSRKKMMLA